ncbi:hypothetical protein ACHQM5_017582 [Ranunculus cassubicifolius]
MEETIDHLFVNCSVVEELWNYFYGCFGMQWESNDSFIQLLQNDECLGWLTEKGKLIWECMVHALFWAVWEERNNRIFEGRELQTWRLMERVKYYLWSWNLGEKAMQKTRIEELMYDSVKLVRG